MHARRFSAALGAALTLFASGCVTDDAPTAALEPGEGGETTRPTSGKRPAERPELPVRCYGPEGAAHQAIFLHGMLPMGSVPAAYDDSSRLEALAAATGWSIAAPQSRIPCNNGTRQWCWTGDDAAGIAQTWSAVVHAAARCLQPGKSFGLVGFSNGGYHAARVAMRCLEPRPRWIVAIGSAGDVSHAEGRDLSWCPPTTLMIGTQDVTRAKAQAFAGKLEALGLPTRFETFPGGHEVPWQRLELFLKEAD